MRHGSRTTPGAGSAPALGVIQWCLVMGIAALAAGTVAAGGAATDPGAGTKAPPAAAVPASADSFAAPARIVTRVVADTLHFTVDLPVREMAGAGALVDRNADGQIDAAEIIASRDTLASYLEHHIFIIQDDGLLSPELIGPLDPGTGVAATARVRAVMRAPLLNTYERIGFASGILTDRIPGYRSIIAIEWKGAHAEFDVAQSIQWVEPPAAGATALELPGRKPDPGSGP